MDAQGVFYQMPYGSEGTKFNSLGEPYGGQPLPPYSVTLFTPSYDKDKFENTALTVERQDRRPEGGLRRRLPGAQRRAAAGLHQLLARRLRLLLPVHGLLGERAGATATGTCYSPRAAWQETEKNTHKSQELRVSTPDDWRMRGIGGVFWEEYKIYDDTNWIYKTVPTCSPTFNDNCFNNVQPPPAIRPRTIRASATTTSASSTTSTRTIIQKAAFGSVDFDIIPKKLTVTAGTRYYHFDEEQLGGDVGSFYCKNFAPTTYFGACTSAPMATASGSVRHSTSTRRRTTARPTRASAAAPT